MLVPSKIQTMFAAFYVCLVFWCLDSAAGAELAPPRNVTMVTLNTQYTLCWDWDHTGNVTFTTQHIARYKLNSKKKSPIWSTVCKDILDRSCDLTLLNLYYLGIHVLRVRASVNGRHSDWVQKEFSPDKDAALGPPTNVILTPAGSDLEVTIFDPLSSNNSSMKELIPTLAYHIMYWERSVDSQASQTHQTLTSSINIVILPNLKPWTWYCVIVQSRYDYYNKGSNFTSPHCMQTEGATPWWEIFLYFLGSLVTCFLVMFPSVYSSFWCYKTLKATLFPSHQLPMHFKEFFGTSPGSDVPCLLTPESESELLCDNVTVRLEPAILEVHDLPPENLPAPLLGLKPGSSAQHSRHDSSSSGDSGVYSTGGRSNSQQPNTSQPIAGVIDCWNGLDAEQVKMQEMALVLNSRPKIPADEGIVDMCV
ncbi:interferon alpha/beta receptor 1b-like [Parambassis ranga]|uniref:Interferon alpha/beta receptor 1b-like n=1 Tax=Parambassis ranga TaxID=210632 RepID=A0A6P7H481_9TELE|nr:interferon alpha/beta receptor 1b-like [Parambassis ranga]